MKTKASRRKDVHVYLIRQAKKKKNDPSIVSPTKYRKLKEKFRVQSGQLWQAKEVAKRLREQLQKYDEKTGTFCCHKIK